MIYIVAASILYVLAGILACFVLSVRYYMDVLRQTNFRRSDGVEYTFVFLFPWIYLVAVGFTKIGKLMDFNAEMLAKRLVKK